MSNEDNLTYVKKVIRSCKTLRQLVICDKWIERIYWHNNFINNNYEKAKNEVQDMWNYLIKTSNWHLDIINERTKES